jgi:membrane protease YdiL (CAAX protease family)
MIFLEVLLLPVLCVGAVAAILILVLGWDPSQQSTRGLLYFILFLTCLLIGHWKFSLKNIGFTGKGIGRGLILAAIVLAVTVAFALPLQLPVSLVPLSSALLSPVVFYLAVALGEELWFRGLIFQGIYNWKGPVAAVAGSALLFGLLHVPLQGWRGISFSLSMGLPFAIIRLKTNNITGLVLAHWLINLIDTFILLSPVSLSQIWVGVLYVVVFGGLSAGIWLSDSRRGSELEVNLL